MEAAKLTVQKTSELLAQCNDVLWDKASFTGTLVKSPATISLLSELDNAGDTQIELETLSGTPLSLATLGSTVNDGDVFKLIVEPIRTQWAFVAQNFDDLLRNFDFALEPPQNYAISNLAYNNVTPNIVCPMEVRVYEQIIAFIRVLKNLAEFVELREKLLVYIGGKRRLDLQTRYTENAMLQKPQFYSKFEHAFAESVHLEVKKTLLISALLETLQNVSDEERFQVLLRKIDVVWQKFRADYELYISEFSFDSEKEKLEERKREYIVNLNSLISGIQNQILAVPISLVLIGGQMKLISSQRTSNEYLSMLLANISILAGAVVFTILMFVLTSNQFRTLQTMKEEYKARQDRYNRELPELFDNLKKSFTDIDNRRCQIWWLLIFVNLIVILGLIFSVGVFLVNLPATRPWIKQILEPFLDWIGMAL